MYSMPQDPNKPAATHAQQFIIVDSKDGKKPTKEFMDEFLETL